MQAVNIPLWSNFQRHENTVNCLKDASSDKKSILDRLQKLEDEVNALRFIVTTGDMGTTAEIKKDSTKRPAGKNENLIEREKPELLQKPEIKGLFDKIDTFLGD